MVPQPEIQNIVQRMLTEQLPGASFRAVDGASRSPLLYDSMIRVLLQINRLVRPPPAANAAQRDLPPRAELTVVNFDQVGSVCWGFHTSCALRRERNAAGGLLISAERSFLIAVQQRMSITALLQ